MTILVLIACDFAVPPALEARWLQDLPAARQAELARWPDRAARHRSLVGTRLLREGLRRFGIDAGALASLRHAPAARPTLDAPLDFSLAHCAGRVLCALSRGGPVGIDVEALGPLVAGGFPSYFSEAERAWAGDDPQRFYSAWTRKEAVVKAAGGQGLGQLRAVDTGAAETGATLAGQAWQTAAIPVGIAYLAHLACGMDRELAQCLTVEHVPRDVLQRGRPPSRQRALPPNDRSLTIQERVYCK